MKKLTMGTILWFSFLIFLRSMTMAQGAGDFAQVEKVLGAKGQMQEGAWVVRFPRSDLKISIAGEPVPIALGFGSWAAFREMDRGMKTMIMGDLVLLEPEVNPVISALEANGIQVTALHNHFFSETPRIMFMHIGAVGEKVALAKGLRQALDQTGAAKAPAEAVSSPPPAPTLNTKNIEKIMGHQGQSGGGVFRITVGRKGVKMMAVEITSSMGLNSWAGFVGTDEKAHVAGDLVMTAKELNPVIRALRTGGIEVVAVHNHMLDEQPRVFYLHYWGTGPAAELAKTMLTAFDQIKGPVR